MRLDKMTVPPDTDAVVHMTRPDGSDYIVGLLVGQNGRLYVTVLDEHNADLRVHHGQTGPEMVTMSVRVDES